MPDYQTILSSLAGFGSLYEVGKTIYTAVRGINEAQIEDENTLKIKNELMGSKSDAQANSAKIVAMMRANIHPFLLRVGTSYDIPPDFRTIEQAVESENIWDWTFCFSRDHMSNATGNHLRSLFCDPNNTRLMKSSLRTTTLVLSRTELPNEFGSSIYISGMYIGNDPYENVYLLNRALFTPMVIAKCVDGHVYGITSPIAMTIIFNELLDYLFNSAKDANDVLFVDQSPPEDRTLPFTW